MNRKSKYLQLYETLRGAIIRGEWAYGARLPSRRQISQEMGLSALTVEHSYALLCQEGYIEARPRSGFYVAYRESDGFAPAASGVSGIAVAPTVAAAKAPDAPRPLATALSFDTLAKTMRRVLSEHGEALLERAPAMGCEALRGALSQYLARSRGIHAAPEQIVIGSGAEYLYGLVVELLDAPRVFAIESPSYHRIEQVYRAKGVDVRLLPLEAGGISSAALAATDATLLHVTPYRSYPTGITAGASKRREYLRWAAQADRLIVEDDFESEFSLLRKPEETLFSLSDRENVIYLNTFSVTVSPSMRVGYMVLPKALLPRYEEKVGFYSCSVPTFEQYVLADLILTGNFERHINRVRRQKRRDAQAQAAPRAEGAP